jgi:Putative beta-lactamase-inhibitor-like, PepSY-like
MVIFNITFSYAQKNIPTNVKDAFAKKFPDVKNAKWEKENNDYEAGFKANKISNSVLFDSKGNLLETEVEIQQADLPNALGILDYVSNSKYGKVKGVSKISSTKDGLIYEVEVKGFDLLFDENGKFIKAVKD